MKLLFCAFLSPFIAVAILAGLVFQPLSLGFCVGRELVSKFIISIKSDMDKKKK